MAYGNGYNYNSYIGKLNGKNVIKGGPNTATKAKTNGGFDYNNKLSTGGKGAGVRTNDMEFKSSKAKTPMHFKLYESTQQNVNNF